MSAVSVVIPVYNGADYLEETISSVLQQAGLPEAPEIVVVDDGSTDNSMSVASRFAGVTVVQQVNQGAAAARNTGVERAQGEFLAFLDADDRWHPHKLDLQLRCLRDAPELDMVFCTISEFLCPRSKLSAQGRAVELRNGLKAFMPSALLIRRAAFDRVGAFSVDYGVGEFIDWYARAVEHGLKGHTLADPLLERRIHDHNQGVTRKDDYGREYLRVLKAARDRRRRSG